jgi:hypothetical protein
MTPIIPQGISAHMFLLRLSSLSQNESDMREKLQPTVAYLQKLGDEYIDQTFKYARWVFQEDQNIAFEVRSKHQSLPEITHASPLSLRRSFNLRTLSSLDPRSPTFSKPSTRGFAPGSSSILSKRKEKIPSLSTTDLQSCTLRWRLLAGARFLKVFQSV